MKKRRIKLIITFVVANIIMYVCTFFVVLYNAALEIRDRYNTFIDETVKNVNASRQNQEYYLEDSEHYISGELNEEYVGMFVDLHQEIASNYYNLSADYGFNLRMYGVTLDENREIIAQSGNKIILIQDKNNEDGEGFGFTRKYRIFDYGKFLSDEEISCINQFFKDKSGSLYMWGKMDDEYVYPEYLGWGDIRDYTSNGDIYYSSYNKIKDYDDYDYSNDFSHEPDSKDLFVYGMDKSYSYKNVDELTSFTTYDFDMDNSFFLLKDSENLYIHNVSYFSKDFDETHITLPNITENVLYKNAKENVINADELSNNCNNSVFDYERICVTEYGFNGQVLYECFSFEGRPFEEALGEISEENYYDTINALVIFNIIFIIAIKIYLNKKNNYDEYTKEIFYEITNKLTDPVDELKRLNDLNETNTEKDVDIRAAIDRAIIDMDRNIRDVLNLSKIEAGILELEIEELELGYLVEGVIEKGNKEYRRNIVMDIDKETIMYGDLHKIIKVVDCFIKNVASRTYDDEKIYVTVKKLNGKSHFEVTNSEEYVMKNTNIGMMSCAKAGSLELMEQGGFELLLTKGYLDLHRAAYYWCNNEGMVKYAFEVSDKELVIKNNKRKGNVQKIYGIVAHEIKTPMNVIKLYNELIREGLLDEADERKYKRIIANQIDIIKNQLNQLVAAKQMGDGSIELIYEWVEIEKLITESIKRYDVLLNDKKIEVNIDVDKDLRVIADRNGMDSIISNYIINAIKYTKIGGKINIKVEETKHMHDLGKCVIFKITNDRLAYAFDNKKVSSKDIRIINRIERDGLGLLIAKEYLRKHKAKYGYVLDEKTAEYWFKIKKIRGV